MSSWRSIAALARRRFGITQFRPGQRELIEAVLAGENMLGVLRWWGLWKGVGYTAQG